MDRINIGKPLYILLLILMVHGYIVNCLNMCPYNYTLFQDSCYKYYDAKATYIIQQKTCKLLGGHLAKVPNGDVQNFLSNLILTDSLVCFGLVSDNVSNTFKWLEDGQDYVGGYENWKTPSPQNYDNRIACTKKSFGFQWKEYSIHNLETRFFCSVPTRSQIMENINAKCPPGFPIIADGSCFGFFEEPVNGWDEAVTQCQCHGGHLMTAHTESQMITMDAVATNYETKVYIGLRDVGGGQFVWPDGTPLNETFWNWYPQDDVTDKECAIISSANRKFMAHCMVQVNYICQIPESTSVRQDYCISMDSSVLYNNTQLIQDNDTATCIHVDGDKLDIDPLADILIVPNCFYPCDPQVHIIVTLGDKAATCKEVALFSQAPMNSSACQTNIWMPCSIVGNYKFDSLTHCEMLCKCYEPASECQLQLWPQQETDICEVTIL